MITPPLKFKIQKRRTLKLRQMWYAKIIAANGAILFTSEKYSNLEDCEHAVQLVVAGCQANQYIPTEVEL